MPATLGTAGHIDHGKTALVAALTGVDTDRLPEERERGISIALGYAALDLPSGRRLSVVDVPGHERFVRTMVAGATGIDLYLMVVAADDGVMPQTREHARVLAALGVTTGVVAVTKCDLADPGRARAEARDLLPGAEVVAVSARTGAGVGDLRAALDHALVAAATDRRPDGPLRLHVDRAFTIRGAGTVATGTLWSGRVAPGQQVALLPSGVQARVRSVHIHDSAVDSADAGQRVALNLAGLRRDAVARGDVVVGAGDDGAPQPTFRVTVRCSAALPARVMVHHGTRESAARAVDRGDGEWQLRLEAPIVPCTGDRVVIRSIAPPDTLGGGVITDGSPPRGDGRAEDLRHPATQILASAAQPTLDAAALALAERLRAAGATPPPDSELDAGVLATLRSHGLAVRVGAAHHFHPDALKDVERRVVALIEAEGAVTLARVRDALGLSRRYVQALLEHLDSERVTIRRGDARVLRRRRG